MNGKRLAKSIVALVVVAAAVWSVTRAWTGRSRAGAMGFFFDGSANRLFTAPRDAVPPIRGVDGPEEDGFRAVVVSTNGRPADRRSWKVVYLEKCSPELKARMEAAQASGEALAMGRLEVQTHRFVRRPEDAQWHAMDSPAAEPILNSWATPGPDGVMPVLCTP